MKIKSNTALKKIAAFTLLFLTVAFMLSACSEDESTEGSEVNVEEIKENESLVINTNEITDTAKFYTVDIDGMKMEIIAVKDSNGEIRTAFNTCQICYSSGKGYYEQEGDYLVCQNCGNRFTADDVEVQSGGCNPVPIFDENKTVTEDTIEISYDYLNGAKQIFQNWKTVY